MFNICVVYAAVVRNLSSVDHSRESVDIDRDMRPRYLCTYSQIDVSRKTGEDVYLGRSD